MYKVNSLTIEEKLKDPYYKKMYDKELETFNDIKPYLLSDDVLLNMLCMTQLNYILEKENEPILDILTYRKYIIADYFANKDEDGKKNKEKILKKMQGDYTNEYLNTTIFQYWTMQYYEAKDLLYAITKIFYLIDKYKETEFSINLLKWINTINCYENYKPKLINKEDIELLPKKEQPKAYQNLSSYYSLCIDYNRICNALKGFLQGQSYNDEELAKIVERYLIDHFGLYYISVYIQIENLEGNNKLEPLKNLLKNCLDTSKGYYETKENLINILEDEAKKNKIDLSLSEEEEQLITNKLNDAFSILSKYRYDKYEYINFNTLTFLLSFNEDTKKWLKDNSTNLTLENFEQKKEEKRKNKKKTTPKIATKEEINAIYQNKVKEYYKTNTTPTNRTILDAYGAYASIDINSIEKIELKIEKLTNQLNIVSKEKEKQKIKTNIEILERKKENLENLQRNLLNTIQEKKENITEIKNEYNEKTKLNLLNKADKEQYESLINSLQIDLYDSLKDLEVFTNKGIAFRGTIFNELEYVSEKGKTLATLRNKDGLPLDPKDIPPLAEAFLRLSNDYYYNRLNNYNEFKDKIDVLFPKNKSTNYRIANETIKRNLGQSGFIINIKDLLKLLNVSEDSYKYYSGNIQDAIKFFNDIQISVQQEDKLTKNEDILNMFFGITNNVYISRQLGNNIYIYYEISSVYLTILDNSNKPIISQNPIQLLKYTTGKEGRKRVFKVGDKLYTLLRESLNNGRGGVKIDENGNYYKTIKINTLLRTLRESGLIRKEARPRKYREDVFNPLIQALDVLSNVENLIDYSLYFDDSDTGRISNDTFKSTFESSLIKITYLQTCDEYENILSKNIKNKQKAHISNANKFILTWGKYKDKTLKEVLEIDKEYLLWILNNNNLKIPKPKILKQHIKNLLEFSESKEQLK